MLIFLPTSLVTLALARSGALLLCLKTERISPPPVRAALLGDCKAAAQLLRQLSPVRGDSIFKGLIVPEDQATIEAPDTLRVLGTTTQLAELINRERITEIIVLNNSMPQTELEQCGVVCKRMGIADELRFRTCNWSSTRKPIHSLRLSDFENNSATISRRHKNYPSGSSTFCLAALRWL